MKKIFLLLILILVASSCKTLKEEEEFLPDAEGYYLLKNMSENQLKKLAEQFELSLAELMEKRAENYKFKRGEHITRTGDTIGLNIFEVHISKENVDIICQFNNFINNNPVAITITPNPTSSYVNFNFFANIGTGNLSEYRPIKVDIQLIFNERIIRQWTIHNYHYTTEIIPEEYLKESGSYALVCNFTGPRGCTASAAASFMVIKK